MPEPSIATAYLSIHDRIDSLLRPLPAETFDLPAPTCPGWTVHGVVSHLVANVEWASEGRLSGPPTDEQTAQQIAERAGATVIELLDRWAPLAPDFAEQVEALGITPAVFDALTHEHDIRHAVGSSDARDSAEVRHFGSMIVEGWRPPTAVTIALPDRMVQVGGGEDDDDDAPALRWTTDLFEAFRVRMGRRSREQILALDWSADPTQVLESLTVFGPSATPIEE